MPQKTPIYVSPCRVCNATGVKRNIKCDFCAGTGEIRTLGKPLNKGGRLLCGAKGEFTFSGQRHCLLCHAVMAFDDDGAICRDCDLKQIALDAELDHGDNPEENY